MDDMIGGEEMGHLGVLGLKSANDVVRVTY
jgi:hypothetical protein